jgi:hypothetical protein
MILDLKPYSLQELDGIKCVINGIANRVIGFGDQIHKTLELKKKSLVE